MVTYSVQRGFGMPSCTESISFSSTVKTLEKSGALSIVSVGAGCASRKQNSAHNRR